LLASNEIYAIQLPAHIAHFACKIEIEHESENELKLNNPNLLVIKTEIL